MEDFERKLRRSAVKRRKLNAPSIKGNAVARDPERKQRRASVRRKKLKSLGIETEVCPICGSDDVSTFEFDHVAGRKHHDQLWPLCETCHQERTSMQREQPPPSDNPHHVLEVIGRWILAIKEYLEMLLPHLGKYGEFLIELSKRGYGSELKPPK